MYDLKTMEQLLDKKRKNDGVLTMEQRYGRYRNKYRELKQEICSCFNTLLPQFLFCNLKFAPGDEAEAVKVQGRCAKIIEEEKGSVKEALETLYAEYDFDKALLKTLRLRNRIVYEAYAPYWLSRCEKTSHPDFTYYNGIIGMYYNPKTSMWANEESATVMFPPTKDMMDREYEEELKAC